jgi:tetratricopeptide (TPR) repeat protein
MITAFLLMKRITLVALVSLLLVGSGCSKKKPEITSLQRKEAANLVNEAEFAIAIRDFPRAEGLMRQAAVHCPDNGSYWLNLGTLTRKSGKKSEAKSSYEKAVVAYADAYMAEPDNGKLLMRQMYAHALLGQFDQARAVLKKARAKHPKDQEVMSDDDSSFDRMLGDKAFKELAI